jgi:arsenate reductase
MIKVYGIKNCDTVKKALNWLDENNIEYQFCDYKKDGIDEKKLQQFVKNFGWQKVLNSKGATFRKLSDSEKPTDFLGAIALMQKQPSIIKRPLIEGGGIWLIGFDIEEYEKAFDK